ncbi:TrkH family potassium uptake protein [Pseudahrensia aquimaris]|uniref:TrkH family potassium uptake protein n=1 Tax=Pseudahrensia aquimaris TaxID=744461 RepID=A0ABW3FC75_9HYPH
MLAVVFYLGCVGLALSVSLIAPIFVALLEGDGAIAERLTIYALLGSFLFAAPVLATRDRAGEISQIGGLILMMCVWLIIPLCAAIPLVGLTELNFLDGLFESVSGLTTTGASTFASLESLPQSVIFWRIQIQWLGGFLALMTVFTVLAPMGIGGLTANAISMEGRTREVAGYARVLNLLRNFGAFYLLVTLLAFLALSALGLRPFYAATLAMTAVSTGGFLPVDDSLDLLLGTAGMVIFAIVLILGATSVFWHRMLLEGQWRRLREHRESYSVLALVFVLTLALVWSLNRVSGTGVNANVLAESLMNASSLVATSGLQSRPGIFSILPLGIVLFIVLLGGSAFSTSGGLKHYRLGAMATQSWNELDRLVYPNAVARKRFGSQHYDLNLMKAIWSFFVVAILIIAVGTIFIASSGIPFEAALTATIAAFSTAGPVYNSGWDSGLAQAWPTYGEFPDAAKIGLMIVMLLGRLEALAVLGLLNTHYWRTR